MELKGLLSLFTKNKKTKNYKISTYLKSTIIIKQQSDPILRDMNPILANRHRFFYVQFGTIFPSTPASSVTYHNVMLRVGFTDFQRFFGNDVIDRLPVAQLN
jgi:hypothetical protein